MKELPLDSSAPPAVNDNGREAALTFCFIGLLMLACTAAIALGLGGLGQ